MYEEFKTKFFGTSYEQRLFEQKVKDAFNPKHDEAKERAYHQAKRAGQHKLKQARTENLRVNIDGGKLGFTYVGPLIMG